ncbi:MAG: phosphate uptake regulator PhoU [Solirubrobacterales bacterium]|nr:phosphate uptake regulator PhoU [Solirubrobacterales bacterium]
MPKFTETVEELEREALGELQAVVRQLDRAVEAVTRQNAALGADVIAAQNDAEQRYRRVQEHLLAALASHRAAADLQMLASLLHVLRGVRRIRAQCENMAKLVGTGIPPAPEAPVLLELVEGAAALSISGVWLARAAFASRDVELAHEVVRLDTELTRRSGVIFRRALELSHAAVVRDWATAMLLVGSYAERVSDTAVDIAEQTVIVVNGLFREVADSDAGAREPAAASRGTN